MASAEYSIHPGNCAANPANCSNALEPTQDPSLVVNGRETYLVRNHQDMYTVKLCVKHPQVAGRKILMMLNAMQNFAGGGTPFDEGDPSMNSPVCMAVAFNMVIPGGVTNTGSGSLSFTESGWDLVSASDVNNWKADLGFRVVR
ncbi:MAG TPA: hypothetical protein VEC17_03475 [Candidatus Binatia bacterium]|nr:hypothetical protein [Candidatus Binatia bacterium]